MPANHRVGPVVAFYGNPNIADGAGMQFLGYSRGNVTANVNLNVTTGKVDQVGMAPLAESVWSSGPMPQLTLPLIDEDKSKLVDYVLGSGTELTIGSWTANSGNTGAVTEPSLSIVGTPIPGRYQLTVSTGGNTAAARYLLTGPSGFADVSAITTSGVSTGAVRIGTLTVTTNLAAQDYFNFIISDPSWGIGSGYSKVADIGTLGVIPVDELKVGNNGVDAPNGVWFPAATCINFGDLIYNLPEGDDAHQPHETVFSSNYLEYDVRPDTEGGADKTGADRVLLPTSHRQMFIGPPGSIAAQTLGGVTYEAPDWSLPAIALPIT